MSQQEKKTEIVFMPGCFDDFEGTQEDLDQLIESIKQMAYSGELKNADQLPEEAKNTIEILDNELSEEEMEIIMSQLNESAENRKRALN